MSMAPVPIVFAFDQRVLRPAVVAINSLVDAAHEDTTYEIHILHPGFNGKIISAFTSILAQTRHRIIFHLVDPRQFDTLPKGRGSWTEIVYYRFLIPEVLKDHDRAIYSDIDVFFKDDLSTLMTLDMGNCPIGAVIGEVNSPNMQCHTYFPENASEYIYMSGFLLFDLTRMRQDDISARILATAREFRRRLKMYDLEALNLACPDIKSLPFDYCVLESIYESDSIKDADEFPWLSKAYKYSDLEKAKIKPTIIHYAGKLGKPWRRINVPYYYRQYLEDVPRALNKRTFRDMRKLLESIVKHKLSKKI